MSGRCRILLSSVVAVIVAGGLQGLARGAGRGEGPPPITITIESDAEIYRAGTTAVFEVTITRRVGRRDLFVPMAHKYIVATYPDAETEVSLTRIDRKRWEFRPVVQRDGERTLTVSLYRDRRMLIAVLEHLVSRIEARNERCRELLGQNPPPCIRRMLERLIAIGEALVARFEGMIAKLKEPLATASKTITVDGTPPVIAGVVPEDGA